MHHIKVRPNPITLSWSFVGWFRLDLVGSIDHYCKKCRRNSRVVTVAGLVLCFDQWVCMLL